MNIVLVNICLRPWMEVRHYPLGLAYVATALHDAGMKFDLIDIEAGRLSDAVVEEKLGAQAYDVVAFGTLVSGYKFARNIAAMARRKNPKAVIIAGNSVGSTITEHLLRNTEVNIAVKGEGEITMLGILKALEKQTPWREVKGLAFLEDGKLVDTGYEEPLKDVNAIPFPRWELFEMERYLAESWRLAPLPYPLPKEELRAVYINSARGCPFKCTFCCHVFQYTKYRHRSAESILSEIWTLQKKYGVNYVTFADELTFPNKTVLKEFVDLILKSNTKFYWRADCRSGLFTEKDLPLLQRVRESGCLGLGYSLESANAEILKAMNKKITVAGFKMQKRVLDKAGLTTHTSLVIGYPQETPQTLQESFDVCYELDLFPSTGYLLPQPSTPVFNMMEKQGLVPDMEDFLMNMGDRQDLRYNLTKMSDDELQSRVKEHLRRIADKLKLDLSEDRLLKTGTYRTKQTERTSVKAT